jgi:uncharacterized protein YdeI (YjbR/CyaY-like superfamily)
MARGAAKSFEAALEQGDRRLGWTIARIPFDVNKAWGSKGMLKVKGDINGFVFRTSLFPTGDGHHLLLVNKKMKAGAKAGLGSVARFRLEPDTAERTVEAPRELARALAEDRAVRRWYDRLNYSTRKYIAEWITDPKSAEARERRAQQTAERLLATMEAEHELPSFIQMAFARDGRAYEGWKRMPPSHRRGHLLGIFYYRNPAARDRRVALTVRLAREYAERKLKS